MRPFLAVLLVPILAFAAPVPKALKKKDDAGLIIGTWKPVQGRTEWFEFTSDGAMKAWMNGGSARTGVAYTWSIDPSTTPKRMTWCTAGQTKPTWECIYELDGDRLRITYVSAGGNLPNEFGSGNGMHICDLLRDASSK